MRSSVAVTALAIMAAVVAALAIGACGGPTEPEDANLRIMLTDNVRILFADNDIDGVEEVNVFFTELRIKRSGESVERAVPIVLSENPQDLLVLVDQAVPLAAASVEPGSYDLIRIELDPERSNVVEVGGATKPLRIPSPQVHNLGEFPVNEDGSTTVVLTFDADKSLSKLDNGDWLMTPVITVFRITLDPGG